MVTFNITTVHADPTPPSGNITQRINSLQAMFNTGSYFSANSQACGHGSLNRLLAKLIQFIKITNTGDKIESQTETSSAITVTLR